MRVKRNVSRLASRKSFLSEQSIDAAEGELRLLSISAATLCAAYLGSDCTCGIHLKYLPLAGSNMTVSTFQMLNLALLIPRSLVVNLKIISQLVSFELFSTWDISTVRP